MASGRIGTPFVKHPVYNAPAILFVMRFRCQFGGDTLGSQNASNLAQRHGLQKPSGL